MMLATILCQLYHQNPYHNPNLSKSLKWISLLDYFNVKYRILLNKESVLAPINSTLKENLKLEDIGRKMME